MSARRTLVSSAPSPGPGEAVVEPPSPAHPSSGGGMSPARLAIVAVLAFWLITPFILGRGFAQDAVPFVAAGELSRSHPADVYGASGDLFTLEERFAAQSCAVSPPGTDCENENVAFVSPPPALPLAVVLSVLGSAWGPLALRIVVSLSLVGGCVAVGRRLLVSGRASEPVLAIVLVLLTPMFAITVALGQNSPLLFLSAALGVAGTTGSRRRAGAVGALWGLTVAFKLTPVVMGAVLVAQRRWRVLWAGLGSLVVLTVGAVAFGGPEMWPWFAESVGALSGEAGKNPYNGSLEAFLHVVVPGADGTTVAIALVWGLRIVAIGIVLAAFLRIGDEDCQWSFAWLASFLLIPLVWWHYLWVAYAAVGIAMATTGRRVPLARPLLLVPMAVVGLPLSIVNGSVHSVPAAQFVFLVGALVWSGWLSVGTRRAEPDGPPTAVGTG